MLKGLSRGSLYGDSMAKTNYNFKTDRYENYEEKIAELESIFGSWPPPFDPVWAVQVSQGRCGSNGLWDIVDSFFEGATGAPHYEALDDEKWIREHNPNRNWILDSNKRYLYYNVHSIEPHRLHFPMLIWFLENSPKVVYLTREDHLTRAISIYYANIMTDRYDTGHRFGKSEVFKESIDIETLKRLIEISIIEIEIIKSLIDKHVDDDRLLKISHFDLYHNDTFNTLRMLSDFLECDSKTHITIQPYKEAHYQYIPNLQKVLEMYDRNILEKSYWIPEGFDIDSAQNEIEEKVKNLIRLNTKVKPRPSFNVSNQKSNVFNIKANQKFYLDEIPVSARYLSHPEFSKLPNLEREIYMLDDRWSTLDFAPDKSYSHFQSLTEVTDIQSNREQDSYEWVCGFSVFFLKESNDPDEERRTLPENHNKLIKGVHQLTRLLQINAQGHFSGFMYHRKFGNGLRGMVYCIGPGLNFVKWLLILRQVRWARFGDHCVYRIQNLNGRYKRIVVLMKNGFLLGLHIGIERNLRVGCPLIFLGVVNSFFGNITGIQNSILIILTIVTTIGISTNFDFLSAGSIVTRPEKMPEHRKNVFGNIFRADIHRKRFIMQAQMPGR